MASERKVVKAGYLVKSPPQEKLMAQWHRRYFILWSDKLMEYYSSHEHKPQDYLKTIDLSKCEDMVAPLPITNRPHIIKLSVVMGGKLRDYYLDCTTEEDMEVWVKCLAKVCGFSPVEGEDAEDDDVYSNISSPEIIDQPVYQDIEDSVVSSFHEVMSPVKRPVLRAPLPSGRLKQSFSHDDLQGMYEEPVCDFNGTDNYHLLQDNGSTPSSSARSTMERCHSLNQEWYDDVGVNDAVVYTMNKYPPPVWKPEGGTNDLPPPLPPDRRALSSEPEDPSRRRGRGALPLPSFAQQASPNRKPLPPPKPMGSTGDMSNVSRQPGKSDMFGIKDNPVFRRKLEEKRQELYGPTTRTRSLSMGDENDLIQESYESVLFTVGITPDPPALPSKTASMRRSVRSPSPPPLPSREVVKPLPVPKQSQPSPRHRGPIGPPDLTSPASPPPLPSRELLDPTRPSITVLLARGQVEQEEAPPPVPLRQSSNRQRNSLPPDQLPSPQPPKRPPPQLPVHGVEYGDGHNQLRRRNSLPSSPTPSDVSELDRRKPIPIPCAANRGRLEPPPPIRTSWSVPNTKPCGRPQPKPKTFKPAPLPRQEVVSNYDDTVPAQSEEATSHFKPHPSPSRHRYHAGENTPQNPVDLPPRVSPRDLQKERSPKRSLDNTPQSPVDVPPRVSPRDLLKERSPKRSPPVPSGKLATRDPLPPPSAAQRGPKPKPPVKPTVPSNKPVVPGGKPTVPTRKPALAEKPSLAQKPVIADKPAPPKKPVAAARNPAMINSSSPPAISPRKPAAPPTAPRRYRPSTDSVSSLDSSPPLLQAPPLTNKHRPKPVLPKKPVPSLCS